MRQRVADRINEGIGEIEAVEKSLPFKKNKTKVVTLRVEEELYQLLEKQAEEWKKPVAETFRNILSFYFIPALYIEKFKNFIEENKDEEFKEWYPTHKEEYLLDISKSQTGRDRVLDYWKFLKRVERYSGLATVFIGEEADLMLKIAEEVFKGSSEEINKEIEARKSFSEYLKNKEVTQAELEQFEEEKERYMKELKGSEEI